MGWLCFMTPEREMKVSVETEVKARCHDENFEFQWIYTILENRSLFNNPWNWFWTNNQNNNLSCLICVKDAFNVVRLGRWLTGGVSSLCPLISGRLTSCSAPWSSPERQINAHTRTCLVSMAAGFFFFFFPFRDTNQSNIECFRIFVSCIIHAQPCAAVHTFLSISKAIGNKVKKNHSATKPPALHCCIQQALCSPPQLWACVCLTELCRRRGTAR